MQIRVIRSQLQNENEPRWLLDLLKSCSHSIFPISYSISSTDGKIHVINMKPMIFHWMNALSTTVGCLSLTWQSLYATFYIPQWHQQYWWNAPTYPCNPIVEEWLKWATIQLCTGYHTFRLMQRQQQEWEKPSEWEATHLVLVVFASKSC